MFTYVSMQGFGYDHSRLQHWPEESAAPAPRGDLRIPCRDRCPKKVCRGEGQRRSIRGTCCRSDRSVGTNWFLHWRSSRRTTVCCMCCNNHRTRYSHLHHRRICHSRRTPSMTRTHRTALLHNGSSQRSPRCLTWCTSCKRSTSSPYNDTFATC